MVQSEAIRDFRLYSRHAQGQTQKTFRSYQHRQRYVLAWLAELGHPDPDIHELSPNLIRRCSYPLSARKLRRRTTEDAMSALRTSVA
jgi:site-specific recombinase XerD